MLRYIAVFLVGLAAGIGGTVLADDSDTKPEPFCFKKTTTTQYYGGAPQTHTRAKCVERKVK